MKTVSIRGIMNREFRTSVSWEDARYVRKGEEVLAKPAVNLPEDSKIEWWISPASLSADWGVDAENSYGVSAWAGEIDFPVPEDPPPEFQQFMEGYMAMLMWLEYEGAAPFKDLETFEWAEGEEESIKKECWDFFVTSLRYLCTALNAGSEYTWKSAGEDFYLTRNGHGSGYWDRGLNPVWKSLTEKSKAYGPTEYYIGDDGKCYS